MHDPKHLELPETKKRASDLGLNSFYTGKKCKNGHLAPRCAKTGNCIVCQEEKGKGKIVPSVRGRSSIRSKENQELAQLAYDSGLSVYKSTRPCPKGHFQRYVMSNNCVDCNNIAMTARADKMRWKRIHKTYGITEDQFSDILERQIGSCAICNAEISKKTAHIDHCHRTGAVRGLLCSKCNQGIGLLMESKEILLSAIKYIEGKK